MRRPLISILVGAITLGIAVNAATPMLVVWIGASWTVAAASVATLGILLLAQPLRVAGRGLRSMFQGRIVEFSATVSGHRGLVVLASPGSGITSAEGSIRYHLSSRRLEHCWLVTGGRASEEAAAGLIAKLVSEGMAIDQLHPVPLAAAAADNPEAVYRQISEIYDKAEDFGLTEIDIIGDYTGGTKSMTAGMILACASPRRHLQFMKPREYTADGRARPEAGADPKRIDISFELIPGRLYRER